MNESMLSIKSNRQWVRSRNGWFLGLFEGIAKSNGWNPNLLRAVWILSVFLYGSGILIYLLLSFLLPYEDEVEKYEEPKILGVCHNLALMKKWELGLVRLLFFASLIISFGLSILVYFILWLILPNEI